MNQTWKHATRTSRPNYRRTLLHALIAFATVLSVAAVPVPAEATSTTSTAPALRPVAATYQWGPYLAYRVGSPNLCIEQSAGVDRSGLPLTTAAGQWNQNETLYLHHENEYDTDTCWMFNNGQKLSVEMVAATDGLCYHFYATANSQNIRTRTILYLNVNTPNCWSTPYRRAHYISAAIGIWLGLAYSGYTSVMNLSLYDSVPWPLDRDIKGLNERYSYWCCKV